MATRLALLPLAIAAGALLVSGVGGVVSRRVATKARRDVTGGGAVGVGSTTALPPSEIGAAALTVTTLSVIVASSVVGEGALRSGPLPRRTLCGREAARWSAALVAAASLEIWLIALVLGR